MNATKILRSALGAAALCAAMVLGEAVVDPGKTASADKWQYYMSNSGDYCEGCCSIPNSLCCNFSDACRRTPLQPGG